MRLISRPVHGLLDYSVGLLLAASPWLFRFAEGGVETHIPVVLGAGAILYSLITRYELGVLKVLPFRVHLLLDVVSGALLASSPWVFGFSDRISLPHLVIGMLEIVVAASTCTDLKKTKPRTVHRAAHSSPLPKLP